jgi:hypothetical protein
LNSVGSASSGFFGSVCLPSLPFLFFFLLPQSILIISPIQKHTATAADTASVGFDCANVGIDSSYCSKFQAVEAFAFLSWILLLAYWVVLLVFAIIAFNNGQSQIWFSSVTDADFSAGSGGAGVTGGGGAYPQGGAVYPPQQQQQTGTGVPPTVTGSAVSPSSFPSHNV